jgi:hypothetical protein
MKYETQYLVFDVSKGPKTIVENLDTYGQDGWELKSMINVAFVRTLQVFHPQH